MAEWRNIFRTIRWLAASFAGVTLLLLQSGCSQPGRAERELPLVVCTTGMLTDTVRELTAGAVEVAGLMGSGVDPHLYKPTRDDIVLLQSADVVVHNGLHLEGKLGSVLTSLSDTVVLEMGSFVPERQLLPGDPHIWMDVGLWRVASEGLSAALSEALPRQSATIARASAQFMGRLVELEDRVRAAIASIPESSRMLITAHDAFSYFGRAYGVEVRGVQGISTESESGLHDIERLVDLIAKRRIPAVFIESSVSPKNIRALVEGVAAVGIELNIGGTLFSDAMGPDGTFEGTYIGMISHNVASIVEALGGNADLAANLKGSSNG